jgi:predicted TIM-barrel fold metal-dependent hydrolase
MVVNDLESSLAQHFIGNKNSGKTTLLPDPEPRERIYTVISVDDHVVEPPDLFEGRLPAKYQDDAPRIVEQDDGAQLWLIDGRLQANVGMCAVVGRPFDEYSSDPARFDQMRPGCYDIDARVKDMDLGGIYASLNFPSMLPGFGGQKFSAVQDHGLGLAILRAWNDWHLEVWAGTHPGRIIPLQLAWLNDPEVAAAEVRRNAERGFHAVAFPEYLHPLGRPSPHSGYWDPFLRACEETETVLCLHVGSSSSTVLAAPDAPVETIPLLFSLNAMIAGIDWLTSGVPVRFPGIKIQLAEGGIGWVPSMLERIDYTYRHHAYAEWSERTGSDMLPSEVFRRNFWFCSLEDPSGFLLRDRIGIDHIMVESDYPHADSTWPDTQDVLDRQLRDLPEGDVRKITYENASRLFRHEVPAEAIRAFSGGVHSHQ